MHFPFSIFIKMALRSINQNIYPSHKCNKYWGFYSLFCKYVRRQTSIINLNNFEVMKSNTNEDQFSKRVVSFQETLLSCIKKTGGFLAQELFISNIGDTPPWKLKIMSLEGISDYIKEYNCKKVITMAGAGLSTSAGIPDFRSPGSGLYHNLQKYKLPYAEAIFDLDYFHKNPQPFFTLAKELIPGNFRPTTSHYFINLLSNKGVLLRHYTQNIDGLERVAGIPEEKIVEAHGSFYSSHCLNCGKSYSLEWMKMAIFDNKIPTCSCNGVVKPDIVFFGENLPDKFYDLVEVDFPKCDLLIVLGSSLVVQPFASLVDYVADICPRLLINKQTVEFAPNWLNSMGIGGGLNFGKDNMRDVIWLGSCDKGCEMLANHLGWGEELKKLHKENCQNFL